MKSVLTVNTVESVHEVFSRGYYHLMISIKKSVYSVKSEFPDRIIIKMFVYYYSIMQ